MLEYPATRKEGIVYFIYKTTPLLLIDADKKTAYKVIKQHMPKVGRAYANYIMYLYL